jgi:hypothetical protein
MNWSMMDEDIALIPVVAVQTAEKRTFSDSRAGWAAHCSILRHHSCRLARLSMHALEPSGIRFSVSVRPRARPEPAL